MQAATGDYSAMVQKWNSDPMAMREMAVTKAKEQAMNHFAGHEKALMAAMDKMTKAKQKYSFLDGAVDVFKKPTNPLKGKPWVERLVPGTSLQIQASNNVWLDLCPSIGYKWTARWTTGAGWNERVSVNTKKWKYVTGDRVYGPRAYVEFLLKRNFYLRSEAELLHAHVTSPYILNQPDAPLNKWVWSYFAGIKKSFNLSDNLMGNMQVLYNMYNPLHRSPYAGRVTLRMGIEIPVRKKNN